MPSIAKVPAADLKELAQYDTPTICNVIELFDVQPRTAGYMDGRIRSCFPEMPPMVGYASTVTFRSAAPPPGGDVYASLEDLVSRIAEMGQSAVAVVQDLDDRAVAATFGEIVCSSLQAFGACGLVTSGAGRDLDQVRALGFPVFTDGTICAHAYAHTIQLDVPVRVGGLNVVTGDLLHGDANGVTSIPVEHAARIAETCAEFVALEAIVIDYVKGGRVDVAGYRKASAEFQRRKSELEKRCRGG